MSTGQPFDDAAVWRLRRRVAAHVADRWEWFGPFVDEAATPDAYRRTMGETRAWGGEAELAALADLERCRVRVYDASRGRWLPSYRPRGAAASSSSSSSSSPSAAARTAVLRYDGRAHYDPL